MSSKPQEEKENIWTSTDNGRETEINEELKLSMVWPPGYVWTQEDC